MQSTNSSLSLNTSHNPVKLSTTEVQMLQKDLDTLRNISEYNNNLSNLEKNNITNQLRPYDQNIKPNDPYLKNQVDLLEDR